MLCCSSCPLESRICRMCSASQRLSTSNVVASGFHDNFHCVFLHRLLHCDHLRLSSCSARWNVPSSTLSARCPATSMDESAEEDHPYTSPTRKLCASKSSLGRKHSVEVCPTRMLDHPYSFGLKVSRGNQQEVTLLGLAALDSTRDRFWSFVFNAKSVFSASRIAITFAAFARHSSRSEISFWKFTCGQCSRSHGI